MTQLWVASEIEILNTVLDTAKHSRIEHTTKNRRQDRREKAEVPVQTWYRRRWRLKGGRQGVYME